LHLGRPSTDVEAIETKDIPSQDSSYGAVNQGEGSAVPVDTPFFHLDLAEAVAAAEVGLLKLSLQSTKDAKEHDPFEAEQHT
jgi:hypothetical protein